MRGIPALVDRRGSGIATAGKRGRAKKPRHPTDLRASPRRGYRALAAGSRRRARSVDDAPIACQRRLAEDVVLAGCGHGRSLPGLVQQVASGSRQATARISHRISIPHQQGPRAGRIACRGEPQRSSGALRSGRGRRAQCFLHCVDRRKAARRRCHGRFHVCRERDRCRARLCQRLRRHRPPAPPRPARRRCHP